MQQKGFTLIEVLIALTLVGIGLVAMISRVQTVVDRTSYLEEKSFAYWLADNIYQELLLEHSLNQKLAKERKDSDTIEYGGRQWVWRMTSEPDVIPVGVGMKVVSDDDDISVGTSSSGEVETRQVDWQIYDVEVNVGVEDGEWLATIEGRVAGARQQ